MQTEGSIRVVLTVSDGRVADVALQSSRQDVSQGLFRGRRPEDVVNTIGGVFSLCGIAQTIAARQAIEASQGVTASATTRSARDMLRLSEMVTQTVLRLCLHWPTAVGPLPDPEPVKAAMAFQSLLGKVYRGALTGEPVQVSQTDTQSLAEMANGLRQRIEKLTSADGMLRDIHHRIEAAGWQSFGALGENAAPEQGAFSRRWDDSAVADVVSEHGPGLLARFQASVEDLQCLIEEMLGIWSQGIDAIPAALMTAKDGSGQAQVETVRGRLKHQVVIADGLIATYAIDAPTEANFERGGVAEAGLLGADATDIETTARLHVLAIDPCVEFDVEVDHA
jgi:coenzyme F420-reducing hydrogenase alpha subunit